MMDDLPANVDFESNPDGWIVEQKDDVIRSVQAFYKRTELIVELWGTTTVISPAGKRYERYEFQQNSWITLDSLEWTAKRLVYSVVDDTHSVDDAIMFERMGRYDDIAMARRI